MQQVVVFGAGVAGASFIKATTTAPVDMTLVDPKDYVELPYPMLRALTDFTGLATMVRRPISDELGVPHIQAKLETLSGHTALLDDGQEIGFDYAILATGSTVRGFESLKLARERTLEERAAEWRMHADLLLHAKDVIIVGGGPVGVELAGEIREAYPAKHVTLIEAGDRLLAALGQWASKKARRVLEGQGVQVMTGQRTAVEADGHTVRLESGEARRADLVYEALGIEIDTSYLESEFREALTPMRAVRVDRLLRVVGSENIFALGDINDTPEIKLGVFATRQARLTARNLNSLLRDQDLRPYRPTKGAMGFVTLGRGAGIAQLPVGRFDPLVRMKQKDLFLSRFFSAEVRVPRTAETVAS